MEREHAVLCAAIVEAGQRALALASAGFQIMTKPDGSPVTSADLEVNRLLESALRGTFPDDGWLSEEAPDSPDRLSKSRVWIIDPIDGTSAFIRRTPHFVISAALVQDGNPVVGAIYNPSTAELFAARSGRGATLNGGAIRANAKPGAKLGLLVNTSELESGRFRAVADVADCRTLGSIAYSLALVAAGMAPAMLTFEKEHEWDVAAAAILLREAGATLTDGFGQPMRFNQPQPLYRGTIAWSPEARPAVDLILGRLRPTG